MIGGGINSSRSSCARRRWGITIDPPTTRPTVRISAACLNAMGDPSSALAAREAALSAFNAAVLKVPEIEQAHMIASHFDYLLKARVRNMQEYRSLLGEKILALPGVSDSRSYVVMEEVKESTELAVL